MTLDYARGLLILDQSRLRNCSGVSPAPRTVTAMVLAFTGSRRGDCDNALPIGHDDVLAFSGGGKLGTDGNGLAWLLRRAKRLADTCKNVAFGNATSVAFVDRSPQRAKSPVLRNR
jgi:hypothetical protein